MQYLEKKNAIIMAICEGTTDVANSDALQMAHKVDPHFERTIGVMTKVDMMDEGTSCLATIQNQVFPLRLGWIPVVCRSHSQTSNAI